MRTTTHREHSPINLLTAFAVEGTSAFVETQRTLLDLMQHENEIVLNGMKERVGRFAPAAAFTNLMRRTLDAVLGAQQELLTIASNRGMEWLNADKVGESRVSSTLAETARDGIDVFVRSQNKFLAALEEETRKATAGKKPEVSPAKTELSVMGREAANALIEAQEKLADIFGQQMNVNLELALHSMETASPARLFSVLSSARKEVERTLEPKKAVVSSAVRPLKLAKSKGNRRRSQSQHERAKAA